MGCRSRFSCLIGAIRQTGQRRAWSDGSCSSHGHGKLWAGKSRWTSRTGRSCAHGTASPARPCRRTTARTSAFGAFCIASRCARPCRLRARTGRSRLHWTAARSSALCAFCIELRLLVCVCAFCIERRLQVVRAFANAVVLVRVVCALLEVVVQGDCRYCASLIKCPS